MRCSPNARRYGAFLGEWGAIYERFGVPSDIGLAQVILESGLSAQRRSEANAIGFCQWLQKNWKRLNHISPTPIEGKNQTTQAPYCAAYLSVLATKYGSFIPALSEHNAGGTNVGRTLINGERMGATDVRTQYLLGSQLARDLRELPGKSYEDVYGSYGLRSYLYAEMVFGNTFIVKNLMASTPQAPIYAMRTPRAISLAEIVTRTGLSADEVRRFNPALVDRVPAQSALYLPSYVSDFGADIAFWRRPAAPSYVAVLNDFMRLDAGPEHWDDPAFARVLTDFRRRFRDTNTEEGTVMDTVLAYVMDQAYTSGRRTLVAEFRSSEQVRRLIERGRLELDVVRLSLHSRRSSPAADFRFASSRRCNFLIAAHLFPLNSGFASDMMSTRVSVAVIAITLVVVALTVRSSAQTPGSRRFVAGEVLVKFRPGVNANARADAHTRRTRVGARRDRAHAGPPRARTGGR